MNKDVKVAPPTISEDRAVTIGGRQAQIFDPHNIAADWADIITEVRIVESVVCVSFGQAVFDADGAPEVRIVSRLRAPIGLMGDMHRLIGDLLAKQAEVRKGAN